MPPRQNPSNIGLRSYQDIPSKYWLPRDDYEGGKEDRDDSVDDISSEPVQEEQEGEG